LLESLTSKCGTKQLLAVLDENIEMAVDCYTAKKEWRGNYTQLSVVETASDQRGSGRAWGPKLSV
jgi:hypothetical protein